MTDHAVRPPSENVCVSLVDGDTTVRRTRQIMLRSERFDVRSYPTCASLLADPRSRDCSCIVVDINMAEVDGVGLLREMRETGWRGKGIILDGIAPGSALLRDAERHGDRVFERTIGDAPLVAAIVASVDRGWAGWNAGA